MKRSFLLTLVLLPLLSLAQNLDSLKNLLHTGAHDTLKAEAYVKICMAYSSNNPDTCVRYADSALRFLKQSKLDKFLPGIYRLKGVAYVNLGNYQESLKCYFDGLKLAEQNKSKKETASILNNIGVNYWYQKSFEKAREYYLRSYELRVELGNKKEISKSLNNLGIISLELKEYDKAIDYYSRALALKKEIGDELGIGNCYNNIGIVYEEQKKLDMALQNFKQALFVFDQINDIRGKLVSLNNIANIYQKMRDFASTEIYAKQALALAKEIDDKEDIKASFEILATSCYKQAKYKDAFEFLREYSIIKDTLYNINKAEAMQEIETKYQTEKKEQELKIKDLTINSQQKEINAARIIKISLIIGLTFFLLASLLIYNRYLLKKKANKIITQQKQEVEVQKKIVEEKNHEIIDSIRYAKHIQEAILPHNQFVKKVFPDSFVLYKPKDIVSGDFYFVEETETHKYFAAVDCTGHGVPGAFISIVGANGLSRCVKEFKLSDPGKMLDKLNELVNETLRQKMHESRIRDGMDIALCVIDKKTRTLKYAGANNPLYYIRNKRLVEIKGDGQPIGTFLEESNIPFKTHPVDMKDGDVYYIFTDGFADQFGGPKGKKYKYKQLKEFLISIYSLTPEEQKTKLETEFENWRGNLEQVDDLCVIGLKAWAPI